MDLRLLRARRLAACALAGLALLAAGGATQAQARTPLDGDGMWIWVLRRSSGGNVTAIVDRARRYGIEALVIKGGDARRKWSQFSPRLVARLQAAGLRVCAYQFVYGRYPRGEAAVGARLARTGADCLVIDAEGHYEGRYAQAQTYIRALRARIGPSYPVGLTSFPYVHYHPAFPYSVFLGPGGAQFNLPQMYWKAIGTSVDRIYSTTYRHNSVYKRPILPLGQVWQHPSSRQIRRFRQLALAYRARGVSWWDWQEANARDWRAVGSLIEQPLTMVPRPSYPVLRRRRSRGDLTVWAQQHLRSAGLPLRITGTFDSRTEQAVMIFQGQQGLPQTGQIGPRTWQALLRYAPAPVRWRRTPRGPRAVAASYGGGRSGPRSAWLPAVRNELRQRGGRR